MKIFITQVANFASIGIIKLLKQIKSQSIQIIGCSYHPNGYTSGSMLIDKCYQSPKVLEDNYAEFILKICRSESVDCIISTDEDELLKLLEIKEQLKCTCIIPNKHVLDLFRNKENATLMMSKINLATPKIIHNLCEFDKNNVPTVIFRKKISVGSKGIKIYDLSKETYIQNLFNNDYFIQKYIKGEEYTVDIFCDQNGNPKIIIPRKRLDIRNGISYKCQLIKNEIIINECKKIYSAYKIPGFSNVQFIFKDNTAYFIELNPRFAGTGIASCIASFNFLLLYLECFILKKELKSYEYYMNLVCWNSIITRYYEETICYEKTF